MKFITSKCPNCGAQIDFEKGKDACVCPYCNSQVSIDLENRRTDVVKIQNHEYEAKLALAKNMEHLFMTGSHIQKNGKSGYDAVIAYYGDAELVGGHHCDYWLALANFYVKGNLHCFENKTRHLLSRQKFLDTYIFYIDNALKFCDTDKTPIEKEKNEMLQMLAVELNRYPERKVINPGKGCLKNSLAFFLVCAIFFSVVFVIYSFHSNDGAENGEKYATRTNPVPKGSTAVIDRSDYENYKYKINMTITEVIRGDDAWGIAKSWNVLNKEPRESKEYLLVKFRVEAIKNYDNRSIEIENINFFNFISNNGTKYGRVLVYGVTPKLSDIYAPAETEGYVCTIIDKGDDPLIVFLEPNGPGGSWAGVWFKTS